MAGKFWTGGETIYCPGNQAQSKLATSIFPLKDGVFLSEDSMAANESCKGKLSKSVRDSGSKSLTLLCKLHDPKKMNPSPFHNRIRKVCALLTAALILPTLAYAGDDQGDGRPGINPGVPNGTYAWHASGSISGNLVNSAAQLTFFANGKITGLRSSSFGGIIVKQLKLTGTFTVNGDGSVSLSLITPSETINFDAYFTPDGNTFTFVETDPGTIVSGFATRGRYFY
jgi:hypothetical protein